MIDRKRETARADRSGSDRVDRRINAWTVCDGKVVEIQPVARRSSHRRPNRSGEVSGCRARCGPCGRSFKPRPAVVNPKRAVADAVLTLSTATLRNVPKSRRASFRGPVESKRTGYSPTHDGQANCAISLGQIRPSNPAFTPLISATSPRDQRPMAGGHPPPLDRHIFDVNPCD